MIHVFLGWFSCSEWTTYGHRRIWRNNLLKDNWSVRFWCKLLEVVWGDELSQTRRGSGGGAHAPAWISSVVVTMLTGHDYINGITYRISCNSRRGCYSFLVPCIMRIGNVCGEDCEGCPSMFIRNSGIYHPSYNLLWCVLFAIWCLF